MKNGGVKMLWQLFISFLKIGLFTIGGGLAMIPLLERTAVKDKKWLTEEEMSECITLSQTIPGVVAVNMATYIGNKKGGIKGTLVSTIGVIIPSFVIIMIVATFFQYIAGNKYVVGALIGVKAGLCGLLLGTLYRMCRRNIKNIFACIIAIITLVLVGLLGINVVYVIIGAAILGIIYNCLRRKLKQKKTILKDSSITCQDKKAEDKLDKAGDE